MLKTQWHLRVVLIVFCFLNLSASFHKLSVLVSVSVIYGSLVFNFQMFIIDFFSLFLWNFVVAPMGTPEVYSSNTLQWGPLTPLLIIIIIIISLYLCLFIYFSG